MYSTIWWLVHSRIPKQGFMYLATSQTVRQSISPSRPAPYVLTARYNFLTNAEICFCSCFQVLAVVIVFRPDEQEDLLVHVVSSACVAIGMLSSIWEGLQSQSSPFRVAVSAAVSKHIDGYLAPRLSWLPVFLPAWDSNTLCAFCFGCPLFQFVLCCAAVPYSLCYRTNTGEICLDRHFAVGCGWCRVVVVGVYFHKTNELGDPFVSIILGCLNCLWIHGFWAVLSERRLKTPRGFSFLVSKKQAKTFGA